MFLELILVTLRPCNVRMTENMFTCSTKDPIANRQIKHRTPLAVYAKVWSPVETLLGGLAVKRSMYPKDNVFQIYYNIGKRLPFQVKRSPRGLKGSRDEEYRYSQEGRTFMVERIEIRNKMYGTAYGYCMIDGVRDDNNEYLQGYEKGTIPCAGCGEWVLIDIPGVDMEEVFPLHEPDFVLPFGKHKGKTLSDIYAEDPKYVFWLAESDRYFRIDFAALTGIDLKDAYAKQQFETEISRVFPKTAISDVITFGKYRGKTYKEVYAQDPDYIQWFLQNNRTLDIDYKSFNDYIFAQSRKQ